MYQTWSIIGRLRYSPVKKKSENPTTTTSRTERIGVLKLKQTFSHFNLIYNRNKVQSNNLPVPSLPVLPTDLPLPLPSQFYPPPLQVSTHRDQCLEILHDHSGSCCSTTVLDLWCSGVQESMPLGCEDC